MATWNLYELGNGRLTPRGSVEANSHKAALKGNYSLIAVEAAKDHEVRRKAAAADAIQTALDAYHHALCDRKHGGVAAQRLVDAVEAALGQTWWDYKKREARP